MCLIILHGFQAPWNVYNKIFIITWFEVTENVHNALYITRFSGHRQLCRIHHMVLMLSTENVHNIFRIHDFEVTENVLNK